MVLLGVDGGNTKTVALVVREDGSVVGAGQAGCADIHNAPTPDDGLDEIAAACARALAAADVSASDLASAAFSLAGADWPEDFERIRRGLEARLGGGPEPLIVNDAIGALRSGSDDWVGVAAVAGTGGAIGGRNARGEIFHLGFWPDGTGAYTLGSDALDAVWRAAIGVGPQTSLTERALAHWGHEDPIGLLHALTRIDGRGDPARDRSRFAYAVLDAATEGDDVARGIVETIGGHLGDYARVCAERTGQLGDTFTLVLTGGVFRHPSPLLRRSILDRVPGAVPVYPGAEPVVGAVLLAADRAGARPELDRLRAASIVAWDD